MSVIKFFSQGNALTLVLLLLWHTVNRAFNICGTLGFEI